jgi:hypothetical protein
LPRAILKVRERAEILRVVRHADEEKVPPLADVLPALDQALVQRIV